MYFFSEPFLLNMTSIHFTACLLLVYTSNDLYMLRQAYYYEYVAYLDNKYKIIHDKDICIFVTEYIPESYARGT